MSAANWYTKSHNCQNSIKYFASEEEGFPVTHTVTVMCGICQAESQETSVPA